MSVRSGAGERDVAPAEVAPPFRIGRVAAESLAALRRLWPLLLAIVVPLSLPDILTTRMLEDWQARVAAEATSAAEMAVRVGLAGLGQMALSLLFYCYVQAAISHAVMAWERDGERPRYADCVARALTHTRPLAALALLFTIGGGGFGFIGGFLMVAPGFWIGDFYTGGLPTIVTLAVLGGAAFLYVVVVWWVTVPAIVAERIGAIAALRRSWRLTRGARWPILGLLLAVLIPSLGAGMTIESGIVPGLALETLAQELASAAFTVLTTVIGAVLPAVAYGRLRAAREGTGAERVAAVFD